MKRVGQALIGLVIGLALGLYYTWGVNPVQYTDTEPASLSPEYRAEYIKLVALAYAAEENIDRARGRLAALDDPQIVQTVTALAQQGAAAGESPQTVKALSALVAALGAAPAVSAIAPLATATPGFIPPPTITPFQLPTRLPTPTPPGAFELAEQSILCEQNQLQPLIQVLTVNAAGEPVPGVEVIVEGGLGFDHFFTGLKSELGTGYGDFAMTPGVDYTVRLVESPGLTVNLSAPVCTDEVGNQFAGSWQLIFKQP